MACKKPFHNLPKSFWIIPNITFSPSHCYEILSQSLSGRNPAELLESLPLFQYVLPYVSMKFQSQHHAFLLSCARLSVFERVFLILYGTTSRSKRWHHIVLYSRYQISEGKDSQSSRYLSRHAHCSYPKPTPVNRFFLNCWFIWVGTFQSLTSLINSWLTFRNRSTSRLCKFSLPFWPITSTTTGVVGS